MLTKTDSHIYLYAMLRHRKVKVDTYKENPKSIQWNNETVKCTNSAKYMYKPPKCNTEPKRQTSMTSVT